MSDKLGDIVSEYIQLKQIFIDLVVIEMSRDHICITLVGRLLYRTEFIYLVIVRHNYDASGMLPCRPLDAGTALYEIVDIVFIRVYVIILNIVLDITKSSFVSYRRYSSGLENIFLSEYLTYITVSHRLVFTGEVQVYIRFLVPLKSQEGRKGYIQTFLLHPDSAFRAHLLRHVVTCIIFIRLIRPLEMLAGRADIVRSQRIDLSYSRHGCGKGRTYRSSGSYEISVRIGLVDQHLCRYVHDRIPIADDRAKLCLQSFLYLRRQRITIY